MQQTLIESLDSEQIAGIVEEMDPGAAADLLSELSDERSEAHPRGNGFPRKRQEVEELLEFSGGLRRWPHDHRIPSPCRKVQELQTPSPPSAPSKETRLPSMRSIFSTRRAELPL